jgi:hypothetical protein
LKGIGFTIDGKKLNFFQRTYINRNYRYYTLNPRWQHRPTEGYLSQSVGGDEPVAMMRKTAVCWRWRLSASAVSI